MKNTLNSLLVISFTLLIGLGCSSFTQGKGAGEKAVEKFHAQMNEEKFDEIYDQATKEFRDSEKKEEIIKFLQVVRKKLGKIKNSNSQGWKVNTTPTGTVVAMTYETEFEQDKASESFTFYIEGEEAKLVGYNVNSKKLVME